MAVVYCTAADVASFLDLVDQSADRTVFDGSSTPTQTEIESYINVAEQFIDEQCETAFGTRTIQRTDEYLQVDWTRREISAHLDYPNVVTFSTGDGDKLEIFDGSDWEDWVLTKTEARDGDFFVDYAMGKIYFINSRPSRLRERLRVRCTYRVRNPIKGSTVPETIKQACVFQVGILLSQTEHQSILYPDGRDDNLSTSDRVQQWQDKFDRLISQYRIGRPWINKSFIPVRY